MNVQLLNTLTSVHLLHSDTEKGGKQAEITGFRKSYDPCGLGWPIGKDEFGCGVILWKV